MVALFAVAVIMMLIKPLTTVTGKLTT